jgi:hypothetical protein
MKRMRTFASTATIEYRLFVLDVAEGLSVTPNTATVADFQ